MKCLTLSFNFGDVVFEVYGDHFDLQQIGKIVRRAKRMVPDPYQLDVELKEVPGNAHRLERTHRASTCVRIHARGGFTKYLTPQGRYHYLSRLH